MTGQADSGRLDLSILVPTVHTRRGTFFPKIADELYGQLDRLPDADRDRVEILALMDNRTFTLGDKRDAMVRLAQGRYVLFIDDDDRVEPDLIATVLAATGSGADVLPFDVSVSIDGGPAKLCRYSIRYSEDRNTATGYVRRPNHIVPVKRELAIAAGFPSLPYREDSGYAERLLPLLATEHRIGRVLYHYDYNAATSETQLTSAHPRQAVDLVIVSRGDTPERRAMTAATATSARAGAVGLELNVIVVEGADADYPEADLVIGQPAGLFNFNASANTGVAAGDAPWVVVANNDLVFEAGWLARLLAAGHPLVSPANPGDARQRAFGNRVGTENGRHFSGWCFMVERKLWKRLSWGETCAGRGFDERVRFWCSDDATIAQAVSQGVKPMLVPTARVRHAGNGTGGDDAAGDGELTWAQLEIFQSIYGPHRLGRDPRYRRWLAARQKTTPVAVI